jgi:dTDP-4-amino-4,6-dideoxygalactose transaminase
MNDVEKSATGVSNVPLLDLKAQYRPIRDEIEAAIREVCDSQNFIMGPQVLALEQSIAEYSQAQYGIGTSSGTDALLVALMALEIGPGQEAITTAYSFFATGGVIARVGARPIFCDIDPDSYNLDPKAVERFLQDKCRARGGRTVNQETGGTVTAVVPTHLYGQMADMTSLGMLADAYGLYLIEDAAQAIGSETGDKRRAGSLGDVGCFSFFPSKNLGAFGDAGMCVTQSEELAERMRVLRLHGASPKYHHAFVGGNFRLDALQAAVLNVKFRFLDGWTADRQRNAERYDKMLNDTSLPIKTPRTQRNWRHIYNQYVIETTDRDGLQAFLREKRVATEVYYPVPLHLQECFRHLGYRQGDFPQAERAAKQTLALPVYPELSQEQQEYVVEQISSYFSSKLSS